MSETSDSPSRGTVQSESQIPPGVRRLAGWFPLLLLALAGWIGWRWSWGTWADIQVDFGRELYVPWRLTEGDVLYRDIAWFNGPLSATFNAMLFRTFGVGLRTLVLANTAIAAGVLAMVYWTVRTMADRQAAFLAALTFLGAFAFSDYVGIGNFNWICPYSHELTHGIALAMLALVLLSHRDGPPSTVSAAAAGVCTGLAFLTKSEVFVALGAASVAAWLLLLQAYRRWSLLLVWLAAIAVTLLAAFGLLARDLSPSAAATALLGSWPYVTSRDVTSNLYFKQLMGMERPAENLLLAAAWLAGTAAYLAILVGLARRMDRRETIPPAVLLAGFFGSCLLVAIVLAWASRTDIARPWPFMLIIALAALLWKTRRQSQRSISREDRLRIVMTTFALALLMRIFLNAHLHHYGFALCLPAAGVLMAAVWTWLPSAAHLQWNGLFLYRTTLLGAWLTALGMLLSSANAQVHQKQYLVGSGPDVFRADARAELIAPIMEHLARHAGKQDTLVVLPEGVMLNYLDRRPNPTPYVSFLPPEMAMFGEEQMFAALRDNPPEWIAFLSRDTSEYGVPLFGQDYGQEISQWIDANYENIVLAGDNPRKPHESWGALLMKRRETALGDTK